MSEKEEVLITDEHNEEANPDQESNIVKIKVNKSLRSKKPESENVELDQNFSDVSFSVSNVSDIDGIYENISNNSDDREDYAFEGNTRNIDEQFQKYTEEELTKLMIKGKDGFDQNTKNLTEEFYKKIASSLSDTKNRTTLEKTNMVTKYTNRDETGDDQTLKLKDDLSGLPVVIQPDITANTNNINIDLSQNINKKNKESNLSSDKEHQSEPEQKSSEPKGNTMSLEFSKEKDSDRKELISNSSKKAGNDEPDKEMEVNASEAKDEKKQAVGEDRADDLE